jgi:site-specific recombinase XerD
LLLYDCALRRSEVCNLNIEDINFDSGELYLRDTKTGDSIGYMNSRVAEAINEYLLYERKPSLQGEKAVFLNKYGKRIGERFLRDNLKQCAVEAGVTRRVYPHMLRASCITHLLNKGVNPLTVQTHARHHSFRTTMIYNRPTQQQMKQDIERIFVVKKEITTEDREKAVTDKYLRGEITMDEMVRLLEVMRPKQLKPSSEFPGYS